MREVTLQHLETLYIDGDIEIYIADIDDHSVRIGIKAPPSVKILRAELPNRLNAPAIKSPLIEKDDRTPRSKTPIYYLRRRKKLVQ